MQIKRKEVVQEAYPKDPPAAPDHTDRTAGGFGGRAPASLDSYGQSSKVCRQNRVICTLGS